MKTKMHPENNDDACLQMATSWVEHSHCEALNAAIPIHSN